MKQGYQGGITKHGIREKCAVAYHYVIFLPYITIDIDKSKKQ